MLIPFVNLVFLGVLAFSEHEAQQNPSLVAREFYGLNLVKVNMYASASSLGTENGT